MASLVRVYRVYKNGIFGQGISEHTYFLNGIFGQGISSV